MSFSRHIYKGQENTDWENSIRMKISKLLLLVLCSIGFTQCAENAQEPVQPVKKKHLFQYQINALNKAKKVNQTLLDSAKRKRKQIDAIE